MAPTRADPDGARPELLRSNAGARATVFGLDVRSGISLSFLEGPSPKSTGRTLELTRARGRAELGWPEATEPICDQRDPDGNVLLRVEAHPKAGYLFSGEAYGAHLLSGDGGQLRCVPEGSPDDLWQRLLTAQILPFAALLQGLEVFHASAVAWRGGAVAITGPSGAGKTSLALGLCRLGAEFVADDVLALEPHDGEILAHPGVKIAGLDHGEARRLEQAQEPRREQVVAINQRERLLRMSGATEPVPLSALFFLERLSDGPPAPRFERIAEAQPLLSANFNFVLSTPERLRGLLEVCALVAHLRVERVVIGPEIDATTLADALLRRVDVAP